MAQTSQRKSKDSMSSPTGSSRRLGVMALIQTGNLEKAHKSLSKVKDDSLWMWLGKAYAERGDLDAASECYSEAVKVNPQNKEALDAQTSLLHRIAVQYASQNNWSVAYKYLKRVVELDSGNVNFQDLMDAVEILGLTSGLNFSQIDSGIPVLEKIQSKNISRVDVAHQLAIFYHQKAIRDEGDSSHRNGRTWDMAFGNWALTLNNLTYWKRWMKSRQKAYEHDLTEEELRKISQHSVPDLIKKIHGQYISGYGKSEQRDGVTRHKQLLAKLNLELMAAHNLAETLDFMRNARRQTKLQVACGPILWEHFHIRNEVEDTAQSALALDAGFSPAKKVLEALQPIGIIRAYVSEGLVDEPIAMLESELAERPRNELAKELLQRVYLEKIKTMVNEPSAAIHKIFQAARKYKLNTDDLEVEYAQQVLVKAGQAHAADRLEEADKLLRDGLKVASHSQTLKDKLADVTNRRVRVLVEGAIAKSPGNLMPTIEQARTILMEVDKIIGPNHPAVMQQLNSLQEAVAQVQTGLGVDRANRAIENFKPGNNYDATIREIDQALAALQTGLRATPGNAHIRQQIDAINKIKNDMAGAEAGYHNQQGVQYLNSAVSYFQSGARSNGITHLKYARDSLQIAVRLQPHNSTIVENLKVAQTLLAQVGIY